MRNGTFCAFCGFRNALISQYILIAKSVNKSQIGQKFRIPKLMRNDQLNKEMTNFKPSRIYVYVECRIPQMNPYFRSKCGMQ